MVEAHGENLVGVFPVIGTPNQIKPEEGYHHAFERLLHITVPGKLPDLFF